MKRDDVLRAIRAAGATGDQRALLRLYTENRVSMAAASQAFREGQQMAQAVAVRDAQAAEKAPSPDGA